MQPFENLSVWKSSIILLKRIYEITRNFPDDERFEMMKQMRRSSQSILANIAEAYSRTSKADKANRYTIARGECSEIYAFLLMARELHYTNPLEIQELLDLTETIGKMLSGLIKYHSTK